MRKSFHLLRVVDVQPETDDAVVVAFDVPDKLSKLFAFSPGQYLTLRADIGGEDVRRSYSICSVPGERLHVGIKHVPDGVFSTFAQRLVPGDKLKVMPPQGRFTVEKDENHTGEALLIAAGSGITPILSIVRSILEGSSSGRVVLIYGNQTTGSIMFREALEELKDRFLDRFQFTHVLSREKQDVDLLQGRIDADKISQMIANGLIRPASADGIYLCGPAGMSEEIVPVLTSRGVPAGRIHVELFDSENDAKPRRVSKEVIKATAKGARVEIILDGVRRSFILSDPDDTVISAAAKSGLDLPFSCKGGMCATCRCKLLEGEVEMARNYVLAPWEVKAGFVLGCQSRPKTDKILLDFDAA